MGQTRRRRIRCPAFPLLPILLLLHSQIEQCFAFVGPATRYHASSFCTALFSSAERGNTSNRGSSSSKKKKGREMTVAELAEQIQNNPAAYYLQDTKKKKKASRSRKRVQAPKQQYLYAAQRAALLERQGKLPRNNETSVTTTAQPQQVINELSPLYQARQLGLVNAAAQHVDAVVDAVEPVIVGTVRVGDEDGVSGSLAYIIEKPLGWAIVGSAPKKTSKVTKPIQSSMKQTDVPNASRAEPTDLKSEASSPEKKKKKKTRMKRVKFKEDDGSADMLEYDEADILAVMTPEEIGEFRAEGGFDAVDDATESMDTDSTTAENIPKVQARADRSDGEERASFASTARPSVVAWLKELKAVEGTPVRGGKYWTAVAGATSVDDTGLVVICPKDKVQNVFIDSATYVAVVGNGKFLAPRARRGKESDVPKDLIHIDVVAKLRKNRMDDTVLTASVTMLEKPSTCNSVVQPLQSQFQDGIRGDPAANPLERRADRRLIHCQSLSVSSLMHDDHVEEATEELPDDIATLAERRNHHDFAQGSFLGRLDLKRNPLTTAYREINGAADGFEGWTVDRYDQWLLIQHDDKHYKGPLPSIHDGNTAGVYYLPSNRDRSAMGSRQDMRPTLLEGEPAPDVVPILENGITYHVALDRDLSTGIFLDQRPQRAWLAKHCDDSTRVLNCFAHCGAFSIAAATAGASTVSLDLNKKWLDRVEPQLEANGIVFDERHDCIYGDCFDWLARLAKRGEQYDIVILDPPSSSVGKKKKRWSVKSDMGSLVSLAAPLVKRGGLLWTTTNSASLTPIKFARMCKKGLDEAGLSSAKLERVVPMPADFPSIGPQPVKNLVWRIPS